MAFLGYSPELLRDLRVAVARSSDELNGWTNTDPEAVDAMAVLRAARQLLDDRWLPIIDGVLSSLIDELRVRQPWLFDVADGWRRTLDPLRDVPGSPAALVADARALARQLLDEPISSMTPAEMIATTDRLLAIADDPAAMSAFREAIGGDAEWAVIFDGLGLDHAQQNARLAWDPGDDVADTRIGLLDTLMVPLADVYQSGPHQAHRAWYPTVIQQLDPYSAALLLTDLDLDSRVAADAAELVMTRWMEGHDDTRVWVDPLTSGANTADLLFVWLALDSQAARLFVERASRNPEVLFRTSAFDRSVQELLLAATDPDSTTVVQAGAMIRPLIEWGVQHDGDISVASDGGIDELHSVLAIVIAPWLAQFAFNTDRWDWHRADGDAALRWVLNDAAALAAMRSVMDDAWAQRLASTPLLDADGHVEPAALNETAGVFSSVYDVMLDLELDAAAQDDLWLGVSLLVAQATASAFVTVPVVVAIAADLTMSAVSPFAQQLLERYFLGTGDRVADAKARFGSATADMAVIAVVTAVGHLIDIGKLPADTLDSFDLDGDGDCETADTYDGIQHFIEALPDSTDPGSVDVLVALSNAFLPAAALGVAC
jgi:hypothetical protein